MSMVSQSAADGAVGAERGLFPFGVIHASISAWGARAPRMKHDVGSVLSAELRKKRTAYFMALAAFLAEAARPGSASPGQMGMRLG